MIFFVSFNKKKYKAIRVFIYSLNGVLLENGNKN